jgi:hypothetical protein
MMNSSEQIPEDLSMVLHSQLTSLFNATIPYKVSAGITHTVKTTGNRDGALG